jgi:uncharacterized repeat protein (TIGR03806 family)
MYNRMAFKHLVMAACMAAPCVSGQLVREPNVTLTLPAQAPVYSTFTFTNAFPTLGSFTRPVVLTTPPGETNILFVVEQNGRIQRITGLDGTPAKSVFLDMAVQVDSSGNEEGLLGLAFHPDFQSNRYFYVFYTQPAGSSNSTRTDRLSRLTAPADWSTSGTVNTATEYVLIDQRDERGNHNAGDLHFGPDGYLYLSLGDEGAANDDLDNSQDIEKDFFAGIIRIDVDRKPGSLEPNPHDDGFGGDAVIRDGGVARYGIPPDNPFVGATNYNGIALTGNVRTEFWATGLRNPWRMGFDPLTGRLFAGDVGQGAREEIHLVGRGDNCGWNYLEGTLSGPDAGEAPPGFDPVDPIFEYAHGAGSQSVIGGRVYRGGALPQLFGKYILAESYDGRVWSLTETSEGSGVFTDEVIASEPFIVAFGEHPGTLEILAANIANGQISELVPVGSPGGTLPATLSDTGAFSDLASLTPNEGIVAYEPNVSFWSDGAEKTRWFSVPDTNLFIGWARDANWSFPTGAVWIKHFELRTDLGDPAVWKRLETRFIVKTADGIYGMTYKWNPVGTEAFLVPPEGTDEVISITRADDSSYSQTWSYPSRSQCLQCHTRAGGYALSFNTRQLNREETYGSHTANQVLALGDAGYFSNEVIPDRDWQRLIPLTDDTQSLHARARSYFDANCAFCHQPDGPAPSAWNGLMTSAFGDAQIYNGDISFDNGNAAARFAVPGSTNDSMVLHRLAGAPPFGRMPPVGSNVRDEAAEALIAEWIIQELAVYKPYSEWRAGQIPDPGEAHEDPDEDGADNEFERITRTDPNNSAERWTHSFAYTNGHIEIEYPLPAGLFVRFESGTNLTDWTSSIHPDYPISSTNQQILIPGAELEEQEFFRALISEP